MRAQILLPPNLDVVWIRCHCYFRIPYTYSFHCIGVLNVDIFTLGEALTIILWAFWFETVAALKYFWSFFTELSWCLCSFFSFFTIEPFSAIFSCVSFLFSMMKFYALAIFKMNAIKYSFSFVKFLVITIAINILRLRSLFGLWI